jgi:hypothetical protein
MGASEAGREARHLGPDLKGLGPGLAMSGGVGVSGTTEEVSYLIVNREKSLGLCRWALWREILDFGAAVGILA